MNGDHRVTLVFDPFDICGAHGLRVSDLASEIDAFREIDRRLQANGDDETILPLTVIVGRPSLAHFRTYRSVQGVLIDDLTPTRRVAEIMGDSPPEWLTDDIIHRLQLLAQKPPSSIAGNWEATVLEWLIPGLASAQSVSDWFQAAGAAPMTAPIRECEQLCSWLSDRFSQLCFTSIQSREIVADLVGALRRSPSPGAFAREWASRIALLPLLDPKPDNPLRDASLDSPSTRDRVLAKQMPLVFPLPAAIQHDVSVRFVDALRRARNRDHKQLELAVVALNALWDGVGKEILNWLDVYPSGLTSAALSHICQLPGFALADGLGKALEAHAPQPIVSSWKGCGDGFSQWVAEYARWLRAAFVRRDLPRVEQDPANEFSRWLKDNYTVSFAHPERSYMSIAGRIRSALGKGRAVLVIIVDALAVHVADIFRDDLSMELGAEPTHGSYLFSPVPTVTEVCKGAILCGQFPNRCSSDLAADLRKSYSLAESQLVLAANWDDANRVRMTPATRLVVYRENRVDDYLSSTGSFKELLKDCSTIAERVASLARRIIDDLRCVTGSTPLLVLTGDHGFTYGPTPGSETSSRRPLDGTRRCVALTDNPTPAESRDELLTFIDGKTFQTRSNYLAARARTFGTGTASGWTMSHGGLLPEEVIIPLFEWFGDEAQILWPKLETVGHAFRERGAWVVTLRLQNPHTMPIVGGALAVGVAGGSARATREFARLQPGQSAELEFEIKSEAAADGDSITLDTATTMWLSPDHRPTSQRSLQIRRGRQLTERTNDQDAFEDMF